MRAAVVRQLERRIGELPSTSRAGHPAHPPAPTGIPSLDGLLPEGGLPRGRPVEWGGPRSCGKTALLRATLTRLLGEGEPVAVVDGGRTLYAPDWVEPAESGLLWVIRPREPREAVWCADLLLRSGAFGAVALDPGEDVPGPDFLLPRGTAVRLQRLAEESGSVWIVLGGLPLAAVRLRFRPGRIEPVAGVFGPFLPLLRPVWIGVAGRAPSAEVPVLCPAPPDRTARTGLPPTRDRKGPR